MNKKYWLRGGVWAASLYFALLILTILIEKGPLGFLASGSFDAFGFGLYLLMWAPYMEFTDSFNTVRGANFMMGIIFTIPFWVIPGVVIGGLYGLLKKTGQSKLIWAILVACLLVAGAIFFN